MRSNNKIILAVTIFAFIIGGCALKGSMVPETSKEKMPIELYNGQIPNFQSTNRVHQAGKYKFELFMEPERPKTNEKVIIDFQLTDTSKNPPWPVRKALIACRARMPNVPGHIHTSRTHKYHPEEKPGQYQMVPMKFGMGGRWDLVVHVMATDTDEFYAVFPIEVEGPPWPSNYVPPKEQKTEDPNESLLKRVR